MASPPTLTEIPAEFRAALDKHRDRLDLELIERALRFSVTAHRGQKRMSGEEFVSHSIAVATILLGQLLDTTSIAAALLHDVAEDTEVGLDDLSREFGTEVAGLVEGLTKISHLTFRSTTEAQVENYPKLERAAALGTYGLIGLYVFDEAELLIRRLMFNSRTRKVCGRGLVAWLAQEYDFASSPFRARFVPNRKNSPVSTTSRD